MINVAIDGPAGAGKSSIAKAVAKKRGYIYVDTGALYRAVAYNMIERGISPDNSNQVISALKELNIGLECSEEGQKVTADGKDVTALIRTTEVSMGASVVSAIPEVRTFLFDLQKKIAIQNNIIMDGRDIGTVVLPDAQLKIFLTASPEERARRRLAEMKDGDSTTFEAVLADIIKRDENDMNRAVSPLKQADDAIFTDTSNMSFDEVVSYIDSLIAETEKKCNL